MELGTGAFRSVDKNLMQHRAAQRESVAPGELRSGRNILAQIAGRPHVIVVDAMQSSGPPGDLTIFCDDFSSLDDRQFHAHRLSAVQAIQLLRQTTGVPFTSVKPVFGSIGHPDALRRGAGAGAGMGITITLDDDLMDELDRMIAEQGYQNRSEAIRDFTRAGMQQAAQKMGKSGNCVAALVYVYDHELLSGYGVLAFQSALL